MNIQKMPAYNAGEMNGEMDGEMETGNREQGTGNKKLPHSGKGEGEFSI